MADDEGLRAGIEQLEAGRSSIALEHFTAAADEAADPGTRSAAMAFAADVTLNLGRPYETIAWAERLRDVTSSPDEANLLEGAAWVALGDGEQAVQRLDDVGSLASTFRDYPPSVLSQLRCEAYGLLGDSDRAVSEALAALREDVALPEVWRAVAVVAAREEVDLSPLVALVPQDRLIDVLGWLADSPPVGTDRVVEALWQVWPGDRRLLALMTSVANQLPLERAMEWSARLRAAGLAEECSVLGIAAREDAPPHDRVRAALVAARTFDDERAIPLLELATVTVPDDDIAGMLTEVLELGTDDAVDAFIVAAASSSRRALDLSAALLERGAEGAAISLAKHAVELSTGQPEELRNASRRALNAASRERLLGVLRTNGAPDVAALLDG